MVSCCEIVVQLTSDMMRILYKINQVLRLYLIEKFPFLFVYLIVKSLAKIVLEVHTLNGSSSFGICLAP